MSDYISREATMSKLRKRQGNFNSNPAKSAMQDAIFIVEDIPAADVAPIVRCKNCRFFGTTQSLLCDMHHRAANDSDYCSYGVERKE
jgi:hypothetical protein